MAQANILQLWPRRGGVIRLPGAEGPPEGKTMPCRESRTLVWSSERVRQNLRGPPSIRYSLRGPLCAGEAFLPKSFMRAPLRLLAFPLRAGGLGRALLKQNNSARVSPTGYRHRDRHRDRYRSDGRRRSARAAHDWRNPAPGRLDVQRPASVQPRTDRGVNTWKGRANIEKM